MKPLCKYYDTTLGRSIAIRRETAAHVLRLWRQVKKLGQRPRYLHARHSRYASYIGFGSDMYILRGRIRFYGSGTGPPW